MLFVYVSGGLGMWMEVGRPCPPVCNDIVTPRHLFSHHMKLASILSLVTDVDTFATRLYTPLFWFNGQHIGPSLGSWSR